MSKPFSVVSCQFLSRTTDDGWTGAAPYRKYADFPISPECMRPKVILRRLERHRELQRLRVSGELAEAREGRLERHRELRQLRVSVASYGANGI